jgi:hypothetical protein
MGLGESKVDQEYYDNTFGYKYGRPLQPIEKSELNNVFYAPSKKNQIGFSSPTPQPQQQQQVIRSNSIDSTNIQTEQGRTFYYYDKPEIVFYPVPVLPPPPPPPRQHRLIIRPSRRYANQQLLMPYQFPAPMPTVPFFRPTVVF